MQLRDALPHRDERPYSVIRPGIAQDLVGDGGALRMRDHSDDITVSLQPPQVGSYPGAHGRELDRAVRQQIAVPQDR
jgi:hypothetical protein